MIINEYKAFSVKDGVNYVYLYTVDGKHTDMAEWYCDNGYFRCTKEEVLSGTARNLKHCQEYDIENNVLPNFSPIKVIDIAQSFPDIEWKTECDTCTRILPVEELSAGKPKEVGGIVIEVSVMRCEDCMYDRIIDDMATVLEDYVSSKYDYEDDFFLDFDWYEFFINILTKDVVEHLFTESFDVIGSNLDTYDYPDTLLEHYRKADEIPDFSISILDHFMWELTKECQWNDDNDKKPCLKIVMPEKIEVKGKKPSFTTLELTMSERNVQKNAYGNIMYACDHCAERHKNDYNKDQMKFSFVQ